MLKKKQNLIKQFFYLILFTLCYSNIPLKAQNAKWVNPFIGTGKSTQFSMWGNYGGTYPGAVSPWGAMQLTPETSKRPAEYGYYYEDNHILFFTCHSHLSGFPNGSHGRLQISFWPTWNISEQMLQDGRSFSHSDEIAKPGYYAVTLDKKDRVEMTATPHNGFFQYNSQAKQTTFLITDGGKLEVVDSLTIRGKLKHTICRFNHPFKSFSLKNDTARICFSQHDTKNGLQIWLSTSDNSFTKSQENADTEIKEWNFYQIKDSVSQCWNKELNSIHIESDNTKDKIKFYTALYHASLLPCTISDTQDKNSNYWLFSPWDTFRSLHPMLSLLKPERQSDMMNSLIQHYRQTGKLPKGPMTGFHMLPILLDSWKKGTIQATPNEIFQICEEHVKSHEHLPAVQAYRESGFLNAHMELSVSITTELAYNDWILSQLAQLTGDKEKEEMYQKRALNYQHLLDTESGFMLPKDGDTLLNQVGELGFQESNRWTGSYFVPHNVQDLINRIGGDSYFAEHLSKAFDEEKILFDNEPVFHYPYLFTWAGRPDLTIKYVHQILQHQYLEEPGGITGNDDLGSMSSWYVLSSIGLFPACPGSGEYLLSTPIFNEITLPVHGHNLTIIKKGEAPEGTVPTIWINGKEHDRWFISHQELLNCDSIVYDGTRPNTQLNLLKKPYSLTSSFPNFEIKTETPTSKYMECGTMNKIPFRVSNTGETGVFIATLRDENNVIATKRLLVEKGKTVTDQLSFTCYKKGLHHLSLGNHHFSIHVKKNKNLKHPLICKEISAPSILPIKDSLKMEFTILNQSETIKEVMVPIYIDGKLAEEYPITLESGENKSFSTTLPPLSKGIKEITILGRKHLVKIFDQPQQACILDLDYKTSTKEAIDQSGFNNHASIHGNVMWKDNYIQTDYNAYLSLPSSKSLMTCTQTITLLTWIAPQEKPNGYADFFTKGEYCCLKMEDPQKLVFFIGGWGRGCCKVQVPTDWYSNWHLIAGVCTGPTIQLYIDGEMKQEIAVAGQLKANEAQWNIGRNVEIPFSRFWKTRMARTRIYGTSLNQEEIRKIYEAEKGNFK